MVASRDDDASRWWQRSAGEDDAQQPQPSAQRTFGLERAAIGVLAAASIATATYMLWSIAVPLSVAGVGMALFSATFRASDKVITALVYVLCGAPTVILLALALTVTLDIKDRTPTDNATLVLYIGLAVLAALLHLYVLLRLSLRVRRARRAALQ